MEQGNLERQVLEILTPLFGPKMAAGTLSLSCSSLRLERAKLSAADMASLAWDLERRMTIFLGSQKASAVGRQLSELKG